MRVSKPETFMRRAVELSCLGYPAPNPHVGCVIVKKGDIVGEGFHGHAGGPHAEVVALEMAGAKARGADVYVTLEPCNHYGRTGPCSLALIDAKVRSVTYAVADPNLRAQGGGERLRKAGVEVKAGLLEDEARAANNVFLAAMQLGRPFVSLKAAASLDGKIALPNGESKWITGSAARIEGHKLRAEMGAVLVGANTILKDDPQLTARVECVVNQPVKVVLDLHNRVPPTAKVFQGPAPVIHFVGEHPKDGQSFLPTQNGCFDLNEVLKQLWEQKITSLLVEGGAATIGSFLQARLFERLDLFVAPIIVGKGMGWSGEFAVENLAKALRLEPAGVQPLDRDLWLRFERPI